VTQPPLPRSHTKRHKEKLKIGTDTYRVVKKNNENMGEKAMNNIDKPKEATHRMKIKKVKLLIEKTRS